MKRVRIYYNIHRECFSVKDHTPGSETYGRVITHTNNVAIADCRFVVSAAGRAAVIAKGVKNVHAYVQGFLLSEEPLLHADTGVTYNPYKAGTFVVKDTGAPIENARLVVGEVVQGRPSLRAFIGSS